MIVRRLRRAPLGSLAERDCRLLFAATTVTTIGDRLGAIALDFAVLGPRNTEGPWREAPSVRPQQAH